MVTAIYSLDKVNGADVMLLGWIICGAIYLLACLLIRENRRRHGLWNILWYLLVSEIVTDIIWAILYYEDGSYVKLDNVTVGYTFKMKENSLVDNLRIYLTGQNLLTITKYSGMDPEINTTSVWNAGIDYCDFYPTVSTVMFGLNISFK